NGSDIVISQTVTRVLSHRLLVGSQRVAHLPHGPVGRTQVVPGSFVFRIDVQDLLILLNGLVVSPVQCVGFAQRELQGDVVRSPRESLLPVAHIGDALLRNVDERVFLHGIHDRRRGVRFLRNNRGGASEEKYQKQWRNQTRWAAQEPFS